MLEQFEGPSCDLFPLIWAKRWQSWLRFQHKAIIPLVKELYANVTSSRDDTGNRCLILEVRKVKIELRFSDIADMFQILGEAPHRATEELSMDLGMENFARIMMGKNNAVWLGPTLPKKSLSPKCIILHRLLCSHFMSLQYYCLSKASHFHG